jgi:hypothetical protein
VIQTAEQRCSMYARQARALNEGGQRVREELDQRVEGSEHVGHSLPVGSFGDATTVVSARRETRRSPQPDRCPRQLPWPLTRPQLEPPQPSPGAQHTVCRRSRRDRWQPYWAAQAPRNDDNSLSVNYLRNPTPSPRGFVDEV